jgi:hypothetical protein
LIKGAISSILGGSGTTFSLLPSFPQATNRKSKEKNKKL